jgi:dCMP deaminase
MKIAALVAERSTCLRHHVGAIIVKDKRVLTSGYNGAAAGTKDCLELGCLRNQLNIPSGERHEICRAIHAEQNAIIQAGKYGQDINGGTMYGTHSPCIVCAKMLINAGVKRFVTYVDYPDIGGVRDLLNEAGVELVKVKRPSDKIVFLD